MELTDYQKDFLKHIYAFRSVLCTMSMQTGKTFASLKAMERKGKTLVLVQNKQIQKKWYAEKEKFKLTTDIEVFTYRTFKELGNYDNIIVDEFHNITSKKSDTYKKLKKMFKTYKFNYIVLLTATPIRQTQTELYFGFSIFGNAFPLIKEYKTKNSFEQYFFDYEIGFNGHYGKYMPMPTKFREHLTQELNVLCNVFNYEHKKKTPKKYNVYFSKKNMEIYNYVLKNNCYPESISETATYEAATKHIQLLQLANSHSKIAGVVDTDYVQKLEYIVKILNKRNKIICYYAFEIEKELITTYLERLNFSVGVDNDVMEGKSTSSDLNVFLVQASKAEGWTLVDRNVMVFFNYNYSGFKYKQSTGRFLSSTNFNEFYYFNLLFENTIEKDRQKVLENKMKMNDLFKKYGVRFNNKQ